MTFAARSVLPANLEVFEHSGQEHEQHIQGTSKTPDVLGVHTHGASL
jgi:hypothetical protein